MQASSKHTGYLSVLVDLIHGFTCFNAMPLTPVPLPTSRRLLRLLPAPWVDASERLALGRTLQCERVLTTSLRHWHRRCLQVVSTWALYSAELAHLIPDCLESHING
jgi:hypothetical protein